MPVDHGLQLQQSGFLKLILKILHTSFSRNTQIGELHTNSLQ